MNNIYQKMLNSENVKVDGQEFFTVADLIPGISFVRLFKALKRHYQIYKRRKELVKLATDNKNFEKLNEVTVKAGKLMSKYIHKPTNDPKQNGKLLVKNIDGMTMLYNSFNLLVENFNPERASKILFGKTLSTSQDAEFDIGLVFQGTFKLSGKNYMRQFNDFLAVAIEPKTDTSELHPFRKFSIEINEVKNPASGNVEYQLSKSQMKAIVNNLGHVVSVMERAKSDLEKTGEKIKKLNDDGKLDAPGLKSYLNNYMSFMLDFQSKINKYGEELESIVKSMIK